MCVCVRACVRACVCVCLCVCNVGTACLASCDLNCLSRSRSRSCFPLEVSQRGCSLSFFCEFCTPRLALFLCWKYSFSRRIIIIITTTTIRNDAVHMRVRATLTDRRHTWRGVWPCTLHGKQR